jgi:hypothetical protein
MALILVIQNVLEREYLISSLAFFKVKDSVSSLATILGKEH